MGAYKEAIYEGFEAVWNFEIEKLGSDQWNEWSKKWLDADGFMTPFGNIADIYDIFSDFSIAANSAGYDADASFSICLVALEMLASGKDPYEIQTRIDDLTEVYVKDGHIIVGSVTIKG